MFGDFKNLKISELEAKILKFWQEKKIFEKSVSRGTTQNRHRTTRKDYVFYDGPPFATGQPHYGHILASVIKDAVPRYETMKGKRVERIWGWDCHGLPVENIVEQNLGFKTKKDIEKYGVEKFNADAREAVLEYVDDWKKTIPRIGRWVDMENAYRTMDASYTESVWWVFKTLFGKKLVYEDYKSMHICPRCETTLSNFEVAQGYKDIRDSSIIVEFEILSSKSATKNSKLKAKTYILAWTTTPWTLPGNVALAVNPDIEYVEVSGQVPGNTYIIAQSRVEAVFGKEYKIIRRIKGRELIGKKYEPLFNYYAKDKKLENHKNGWKIYGADFVKTDEGTGVVHIAPAFGEEDMNLGRKYKLPFVQHVAMDGRFKKEVKDFANLPVKPKGDWKSTDNKIIALLDKQDKLFSKEEITHSYPHCWRCDTPLLNYAASSWFVKVTAIKKNLLASNQKINWIPSHIKEGRFGKGLEDAPDWAISRSRYWGAPIPVWRCDKCKEQKVIGSIAELKDNSKKSGNRYFLMRHGEYTGLIKNINSCSLETSKKYPLTKKGIEDVEKRAAELKKQKIDFIFASDLFRTRETTKILAGEIGLQKNKIILDKRLREVNVGIFDGKDADKYEHYASVEKKFYEGPPRGENLTQLKNRVGEFLYEIDSKHKNKNILVVSHEYTLWLLMAAAHGYDAKQSIKLKKERETRDKDHEIVRTAELVPLEFVPLPHGKNYELDLHRPYIDSVKITCKCGGEMKRVDYVFDCWFESGAMPYGQSHYPFKNRQKFEKNFPAEFIAEGLDQTRGWFYTLLVLSTALFNKPAYKNVIVNGIILAEDGSKMSKRLHNYPDPMEIVAKYGADALRYYLLSSPVMRAEDLNFSEKGVDAIYKKVILRLLNVYSFYELYVSQSHLKAKSLKLKAGNVLDKWILARLKQLAGEVTKAMDSYELDRACRPIADFIDDLSTWYIRRSRDRFRLGGKDKDAAFATTRAVLLGFSKIIAPFMPFMAEALYQSLNQNENSKIKNVESVHLEDWPDVRLKISKEDLKLINEMKLVRQMVSLGLEARAKAGIKVRQPLQKLEIRNEKLEIRSKTELLKILAEEVNVKKIIFNFKIKNEVELDTEITPELKQEGTVREFVRLVQGLRQEAGYIPKDKINVWLEVPKETQNSIQRSLSEFKNRIGAKNVVFSKSQKFDAELESNLYGQKIWLAIRKV